MAEEKLDLLDLDDEIDLPELPEDGALACGRPRRPWFLFGAAVIVIILATYIIVRIVMHGTKNDSVEIDLNTPPLPPATEQAATPPSPPASDFAAGADKVIAGEAPVAGVPVRVVEERKDVVFKPDAPVAAPAKVAPKIEPQKPRPITKTPVKKAAPERATVEKRAPKPVTSLNNGFYVQFGSYATRSGAEVSQKKLQVSHAGLFSGHNFIIQEALLPNGKTTYRLRIGFTNSQDADGFCRNAKSDGLDCYVAR